MSVELVPQRELNNFVMDTSNQNHFQERILPVKATLASYAALIRACDLRVPLPRNLSAIGERHKFMESCQLRLKLPKSYGWRIYTPRYKPDASLEGCLTFALKYESLDLAGLTVTGPASLVELVKSKPTGTYTRHIWLLYEWLTR